MQPKYELVATESDTPKHLECNLEKDINANTNKSKYKMTLPTYMTKHANTLESFPTTKLCGSETNTIEYYTNHTTCYPPAYNHLK